MRTFLLFAAAALTIGAGTVPVQAVTCEDVRGLTEREAAELAVAAVDRLRRDIGVPGRLRDLGVQASQLRAFAEKAESIKRILRVNPRMPTAEEIETIYQAAY